MSGEGWGAAAQAVTQLVGGWLSDEAAEDRNNANLNFAREQQARNEALQREFAQQGIRWKVSDAQAAGVHPLFALGAGGAAFAPNPVVLPFGESESGVGRAVQSMGQDVGRAVRATMSQPQRDVYELEMERLRADVEKDFALSSAVASLAKRVELESGPSFPVVNANYVGDLPLAEFQRLSGDVLHKPDEVVSNMPGNHSVAAGVHPAWMRTEYARGVPLMMPRTDDVGETLSEAGPILWSQMIMRSVDEFGPEWLHKFARIAVPGYGTGVELIRDSLNLLDDRVKRWAYGVVRGPVRNRATGRIRGAEEVPYSTENWNRR